MVPFVQAIKTGMQPAHLLSMNATALEVIAQKLNSVHGGQVLEIPNLFTFMRDLGYVASTRALYGTVNPFEKQPSLREDLW